MSGKIKVSYIDHMGTDLTVTNSARVSFNKKKDIFDDKDEKLIKYLSEHSHMTPFEHALVTLMIEVPFPIRNHIMKHRTGKYNEISRRYTSEDLEFYIPPVEDMRLQSKNNKQCSEGLVDFDKAMLIHAKFQVHYQQCLNLYNELLDLGLSREQSRFVLPEGTMTKFYMTMDLRNFANFLKLRLGKDAQKETQYVAQQVKDILNEKFPISMKYLMKDINV
jgi:thymidylate synthase (FAD)